MGILTAFFQCGALVNVAGPSACIAKERLIAFVLDLIPCPAKRQIKTNPLVHSLPAHCDQVALSCEETLLEVQHIDQVDSTFRILQLRQRIRRAHLPLAEEVLRLGMVKPPVMS